MSKRLTTIQPHLLPEQLATTNQIVIRPSRPDIERPSDPALEVELLRFSGGLWKTGDAFQGTQIFGGTGSGKTTGSGAAIAKALLAAGFGGLVLTAKADECDLWKKYAKSTGRVADIVEISVGTECAFNILEYEFHQGGGLTSNIVSLLVGAMSTGEGSVSQSEPYWTEALREMLTHAIDLVVFGSLGETWTKTGALAGARPQIRLSDIVRLIRSAPQSLAEIGTTTWQKRSRFWQTMQRAAVLIDAKALPAPRQRDLEQTADYWLRDFPSLAPRTRSIVVSTFTAKVSGLLRSPIRDLFFEDTNPRFSPHVSFSGDRASGAGNRIVVLNVPVKEYGEVGRFCQVLYKTIWQRAADRRTSALKLSPQEAEARVRQGTLTPEAACSTAPAFLWADESQYFVTHEDMLFQQTARSSRVATVYLTQNIGNYEVAFGPKAGRAHVNSLLGNLQTKVFHANGDPATNEFAESVFAKRWKDVRSESTNQGDSVQEGRMTLSSGASQQMSAQLAPAVDARKFTLLASGGLRFNYLVQAWVFQSSRNWNAPGEGKDGANAVFVEFEQNL